MPVLELLHGSALFLTHLGPPDAGNYVAMALISLPQSREKSRSVRLAECINEDPSRHLLRGMFSF